MLSAAASRRLPLPATTIPIDEWLFGLTDEEYRATARAHLGAGRFTTSDGRRGLFDAEGFATAFIVNHHVEEEARRDYVRVRSRDSRAWLLRLVPVRLDVCWEMRITPRGDDASDAECRLQIGLRNRGLEVVGRALGAGVLQRRHVEEQMGGFAESIVARYGNGGEADGR